MASVDPSSPAAKQKQYSAPTLTRFGHVADLTQSGSGQASESASGMAEMCGPAFKSHEQGC
jgi:hypothetical protein